MPYNNVSECYDVIDMWGYIEMTNSIWMRNMYNCIVTTDKQNRVYIHVNDEYHHHDHDHDVKMISYEILYTDIDLYIVH